MKKINKLILCFFSTMLCFFGIMYVIKYYDGKNEIEVEIVKYFDYDSRKEIEDYIIGSKNKKIPIYSLVKENNIYKVTYKNSNISHKILTYDMKIRKTYYDYDSSRMEIPHNVNYSEYNTEHSSTFNGILKLTNLTVCDKSFIAEYSGTLYGINEYDINNE